MLKYKLIKTSNAKGPFYCPCTINGTTFDMNDIAREIQNNSSFKRSDVLGILCELKETLFRPSRDLTGVRCCFSPTAHGSGRQKDLYKNLEFVRVRGGG